ncbi:putative copper resistance protein D [Herbaspirillum sp. Sphag1AN]|uniref:copper homeostasis membrane protein CopD n=1 Tax=unclassified Herbaspirillum TaxID=2624150 RepID=UPI001622F425|nr:MULTISPECIES: copper homeostasis membrane protein CopD [unclassified Herbaspirillum]MBB3213096.1 putative copper resistance protein D [Herbaspirillum sp. Sphag1AN]MBB3246293.1 putative copper resistance protein D [Herbaspirillum sp. Sphag64]
MNSVDLALLGCRFVFDTAALFLWGASAFLCFLVPPDLKQPIRQQLTPLWTLAWLGIGLGVAAYLPLQTARIGDGWHDALNVNVLYSVATGTSVGAAWCSQVLCLVMLGLLRIRAHAWRLHIDVLTSALLLLSLTMTGHAVMDDGWLRIAHQCNDALHLLSCGGWAGALVVVLALLPRITKADSSASAQLALRRFSNAGHIAVLLVLVSGSVSTFLIVGSWPFNWALAYQRLLCIKITLVLLMTTLAIVNRYLLVPRMQGSACAPRLFVWATFAEIGLALIVMLQVACFGMLEPV